MQNFALLKEVGKARRPVLLKRGLAATMEEWFYAAEYILAQGNEEVILAERGIRTFERWTRNTLDLSAVALAKQETHLPVVVDVTHAAGRTDLLAPLARAALAVGADGVHVEVHPSPKVALSDSQQQLDFAQFDRFLEAIRDLLPELMGLLDNLLNAFLKATDPRPRYTESRCLLYKNSVGGCDKCYQPAPRGRCGWKGGGWSWTRSCARGAASAPGSAPASPGIPSRGHPGGPHPGEGEA